MFVSDWHGAPPRVFGLMLTLIGHTEIGTESRPGRISASSYVTAAPEITLW